MSGCLGVVVGHRGRGGRAGGGPSPRGTVEAGEHPQEGWGPAFRRKHGVMRAQKRQGERG